MVQGVARQVAPLLATLGSFARGQGVAQYAVPALVGSGKRAVPPLSEPLPDVHFPSAVVPQAPQLKVGAVNGVKAAALDAGGPNCCVGVFVAGGSAAETATTSGSAKLLEYLAFSATANRTTFRFTRELEKYGAAASAAAGREHIGYVIEGTKLQAAEITEMVLDAALNMRLTDWEVHDMLGHAAEEVAAAYTRPGVMVAELLHKAAFSGGLAQPLLPDPSTVYGLTAAAVKEYVDAVFTPANMVITGAGVNMGVLEQVAGPLLPSGGGSPSVPSSKYTGGVITSVMPDVAPTVAVAYEVKGGAGDLKALAMAAVLKSLLHEGREVLPWLNKASPDLLTSVTPVVQMYRTTGLVGLVGTTAPGKAAAAADALLGRLEALAKGVKAEALAAAKALVVGGYSSAVSGKMGVVQDMGGQLLARGSFSSGEYVAAVSGLTAGDVSKAVADMLKGVPSLVATGALADVPKYDATAKKFV